MGAAGGAVAAIAAAKQRRREEVVDAFRLGDATSPERARRVEDLGIAHLDEVDELLSNGVLLPGKREGTYFLSEAGYIVRRDERFTMKRGVVVLLAVLMVVGMVALLFVARRQ